MSLSKGLVRSHLEYAVQLFSPYLKKVIDVLEIAQHNETKLIRGIST